MGSRLSDVRMHDGDFMTQDLPSLQSTEKNVEQTSRAPLPSFIRHERLTHSCAPPAPFYSIASTAAGTTPHEVPVCWDIGTRFGQRLRELRHARNMTQLDMAVMLGIDRSFISEVECGKKGISLALLEVIALGFHLSLSDLLRDL